MNDNSAIPDETGQGGPEGLIGADSSTDKKSWILPAVLVAVACAVTWFWVAEVQLLPGALAGLDSGLDGPWSGGYPARTLRLTADQRFLLEGDTSRDEPHAQKRAIWEAHPTNLVYLGNYLSALAAGPGQDTNRLAYCREEIAAARKVDPENARLDYLEAAWMLQAAAEVVQSSPGEDEDGDKLPDYTLEIRDRAALDEAMNLLIEGAKKPHLRRYSAEMLQLQFQVLGPPRRLIELVQRVAVAAGVLLPDLAGHRNLSRASRSYAKLLIAEGRPEEAIPFLEAWHPLTGHLARDSFTLIDVLVVGALAKDAGQTVPPIYRAMGREDEADLAATRAAALAKPVADWRQDREKADGSDGETIARKRGGVLVRLLLPALGTWPDESEYAPSRTVEYAAATEGLLAVLCLALLAVMLLCLAMTLRWRLTGGDAASQPALLMPEMRVLGRILLLGVLVPLAAFLLITRWLPMSGHAWSLAAGEHKLLAEGCLLLSALVVIPVGMTATFVRRRCEALGVPATDWYARYLSWPFGLGVVTLALIWLCPATEHEGVKIVARIAAGVIGISFVVGALLTLAQGFGGQRTYGKFYGTSFLTLIPVLALVIIALGFLARPYLGMAQADSLAKDTLVYESDRPGFTRLESDLVDQLKAEIMTEVDRQRSH